jgi:hypothetical protein
MYNCSVYRNQPHGLVGDKAAYATPANHLNTRGSLSRLIATFDAASQCREVTCLYNHVNWWIEDLVAHPEKLDLIEPLAAGPSGSDYFL